MTTQEHLWNDKVHLFKMYRACVDHCEDLQERHQLGEIDDDRMMDIMPSAIHQLELFDDRLNELEEED